MAHEAHEVWIFFGRRAPGIEIAEITRSTRGVIRVRPFLGCLKSTFIVYTAELKARSCGQPLDRVFVEEWPGRHYHDKREGRSQQSDVHRELDVL